MSYAELHTVTNFTFMVGASHPEEMVERADALGYEALAITDRNSLAGVVRAYTGWKAVQQNDAEGEAAVERPARSPLKLIIGSEITPEDAPPVVLWAPDRAAYGRLSTLITHGRRRAEKGECRLSLEDIAQHADGLIAGVLPYPPGHYENDDVSPNDDAEKKRKPFRGRFPEYVDAYREIFGDRCRLLLSLHDGPDDARRLAWFRDFSRRCDVPLVACGGVYYHEPRRKLLRDLLTAVRHNTTLQAVADRFDPNAQRHLRSLDDMQRLFAAAPEALENARAIASECTFSLEELRYDYPEEFAPDGMTPIAFLRRLAWEGAKQRYPEGVPDKVKRLLLHELELIEELHYEAYFLTVWDLVRFARSRGILCQGRGSAANSAVCYCLGVTAVDPARVDLLFERFISRERDEAPDIDVDFEHERREEVLQYLYEKYGRERAAMTGVVTTYRARSAIRDVGRALGLSLDCVDRLSKRVDKYGANGDLEECCRWAGLPPESPVGKRFTYLTERLIGFPRHLSQHTGGMVMTCGPISELVPVENAAMPGRTVLQWNKDDLDELGILKVDCLALGMLTAIRRCFDLVRTHSGRDLQLNTVPQDDPRVYDMICRADTVGVFQIESRAQMSMLPRLRPRCFYDLVIEVAIVRPGPIQGDMVHPYLRRRHGEEQVTYPTPEIRGVLEKTLGVPLFQEQAMRMAVVAAGFTPGEADLLRRAMGAWRRPGLIDKFREKLIRGMLARGYSTKYAEAIFNQIRGFGEYGFPESHAASFALLVYVSSWLKRHYPAAFAAAIINSQPMGFYAPAQLVRDAKEHGVRVSPADVNHSDWECTLEPLSSDDASVNQQASCDLWGDAKTHAIRLGLLMVQGLGESDGRRIEAARKSGGAFISMDDFSRRTGLRAATCRRLAEADAFGSLELHRRAAMWDALGQKHEDRPLFDAMPEAVPEAPKSLAAPRLSEAEEVVADYRSLGLSLKDHPMRFLREELSASGVSCSKELPYRRDGSWTRVAGVVLCRQRPGTAKGVTFMTLEDETGVINLLIRPDVWNKFRQEAVGATVLRAEGRLQRQDGVIHVIVAKMADLSERFADLVAASRDFH